MNPLVTEKITRTYSLHNIRLMFQSSDNHPTYSNADRSDWIAILARAPIEMLENAIAEVTHVEPIWLRKPETGLMMIEGRAGATGQRFNLGEVTVTRCALRLPGNDSHSPVGVSYILGRSHKHARLAALLDAHFLSAADATAFQKILEPIKEHLSRLNANKQQDIQTSKVEFFTVARESGSGDDSEQDE